MYAVETEAMEPGAVAESARVILRLQRPVRGPSSTHAPQGSKSCSTLYLTDLTVLDAQEADATSERRPKIGRKAAEARHDGAAQAERSW